MCSLVGYRFQPTPEELVSHFLKKKSCDPAFTDPTIREVNIYKHRPCELPGLASIQSDEQVWYFFCTLDNKYAKSDRASRTAKGGSWKITGTKRDVKAKHSNKPIGFRKTLVFYEGRNTRKENRTNWVMHEYHEYPRNKDPLLQGKVVVCRIERKSNKKHDPPSSAFDEGDNMACDSGNNVAQDIVPELVTQLLQHDLHLPSSSDEEEPQLPPSQHITKYIFPEPEAQLLPNQPISSNGEGVQKFITSERGSQLLPNQHLSSNTEDEVAKDIFSEVEPLVPAEWDALIGYNELQSPISSGDSNVWNTPLESEQEDDFENPKWDIRGEFFAEETGHFPLPDVNSSKTVTEAHIRYGSTDEDAETIDALLNEFSSSTNEEY
ncbi:hypothetical protein EZV62_022900 [Acer yangbiense]|uniref:NAC domain-containing protein n=1 Tax=Acer yangbiense TaxID=1000413 RepID=A0A5C7H281_9ROSI|nr:hypothetical protein EZV62_022900 [Acer yangbiense]